MLGLSWIINDPVSKISNGATDIASWLSIGNFSGANVLILTALACFILLLVMRIPRYDNVTRDRMLAVIFFAVVTTFFWALFEQAPGSLTIFAKENTNRVLEGSSAMTFKVVNSLMTIIPLGIITWVLSKLFKQTFGRFAMSNIILGIIIAFAPLFSKWWESKYNPSANMKYAIGMLLLGMGMAVVAVGASGIPVGGKAAVGVSIFWLVFVYLFHTLGELCVSPVALSYVSKLVPGRMIAFMFAMWYIAVAIGMKLAGVFGEMSETIANEHGLSYFFWILTAIAVGFAIFSAAMSFVVKKLMHGVH